MKKFSIILLAILSYSAGFSQNIGINATGTPPHASAMLDISSTNRGLLIPRMTSAERIAITTPGRGLLVFDTDNNSFWFYTGAAWSQMSVGSNGWNLTGNALTNPATHFLGTTDNQPLRFRVNNLWAGEIHPTNGNLFLGLGSGQINTTGSNNTATGQGALTSNANGTFNTGVGYAALYSNTGGQYNTAIGSGALNLNLANANTAIGAESLLANTSGFANSAIGFEALKSNTIGYYNIANGNGALNSNTTASNNIAIGSNALALQSFSNGGVAWSSNNVAVGYNALYSNNPTAIFNGINNTAIGTSALYKNTFGTANTATGTNALFNNQSGFYNTAIGKDALINNTDASFNTAIGYKALFNNNGSYNTANGYQALYNLVGGSNNIAIGFNSGNDPGSPNVNNTISIGNDGILNGTNNQVIIGNFSTVGYFSHNSWNTFSDARIKTDIKEEVKGLDFIMRLKPVTYHKSINAMLALTGSKQTKDFPGKYDIEKIKFSGFLAQEVEKAANESGYDFSGIHKPNNSKELYALSYETFVVPLVKAVQEQQTIINKQDKLIEDLLKRVTALEQKK